MSPRDPRGRRDDHHGKSAPQTRSKPAHKPEGRRTGLPPGVRIVHEDDDLLVVDKPTGLVTATPPPERGPGSRAPIPGASVRTLFDALKRHFTATSPAFRAARSNRRGRNRGEDGEERRDPETRGLWIIHRLDKEASGLLVFAKSLRAFNWLKEDLRARRVHRVYMAVTEGVRGPAGTTVTHQSMIADDRDAGHRSAHPRGRSAKPQSAAEGADRQLAVTHFRVIASGHDRSLVQVRLDTGRKNQIRIHMSELGSPLIGDQRFGAKTDPLKRLALHAAELTFTHPATGQPVTFLSPAPGAFYSCVGAVAPKAVTPASPAESSPPQPARRPSPAAAPADTSWNKVAAWYDDLLEDRGNDLYEQVIIPGTLKLIEPRAGMHILDLACGQGILSRRLSGLGAHVCGVDSAPDLINTAKARGSPGPAIAYSVADARKLDTKALREHAPKGYDAITCVMALANIDSLEPVAAAVSALLRPGGAFIAVVTHPAFRAVGQTSWDWDQKTQKQFRRVDGYLSPGQAPIEMHPGKAAHGRAPTTTWTFHRPIQSYVAALAGAGLLIERLEEWPSMRASQPGPRAAEENRTRREIPMFLGIRAVKR